jgi:inorganic pyrophosphatase
MEDIKVTVFVEIEKDSNQKFEYNHETKTLELDRILESPYFYPYSYGFVPNTKAKDNDELDILIITNKKISNNQYYEVFIVGVLVMEDENGMDEKVLCVLEEDYNKINDLDNIDENVKNSIHSFFTNYKNKSIGRWSKVYGFENKKYAIDLYKKSLL